MLLPHVGVWQRLLQPSFSTVLPSSHGSADALKTPSPHDGAVQSLSQVAELPPVSHVSPLSTIELPQTGSVQLFSHASPFVVLPSSHGSAALLNTPSPHEGAVQSLSQVAELPPVSQTSP